MNPEFVSEFADVMHWVFIGTIVICVILNGIYGIYLYIKYKLILQPKENKK